MRTTVMAHSFTMNNHAQQFREAMAAAGLLYSGDLIADGVLHRFTADGDKAHKKNSWYVLHDDGLPAGAFGCWKRDMAGTWSAKPEKEYTAQEREQHRQRMESMKRQREQEQQQRQQEAKNKAVKMWEAARKLETSKGHFYTAAKAVRPFGVRVLRGMLLVPVFSAMRELVGLQLIAQDEAGSTTKRFLTGTPLAGSYCTLGKASPDCEALAIGEGWATMASVHAATGLPCVVAFAANNLQAVALVMREKFPTAKLILCADDDGESEQRNGKNAGVAAAQRAAAAVGGYVAMPHLSQQRRGLAA